MLGVFIFLDPKKIIDNYLWKFHSSFHYFNRVLDRIDLIFENYEQSGGDYHPCVEVTDEDEGEVTPAEESSYPDDVFDDC